MTQALAKSYVASNSQNSMDMFAATGVKESQFSRNSMEQLAEKAVKAIAMEILAETTLLRTYSPISNWCPNLKAKRGLPLVPKWTRHQWGRSAERVLGNV